MIDISLLRESIEELKKAVARKGFDTSSVDKALELDIARRKLDTEIQGLRARLNDLSDKIGKGDKDLVGAAADTKKELKLKGPELEKANNDFNYVFSQIPNPPLEVVPDGRGDSDNLEVKKWGDIPKFDFEAKDHLEIGTKLGILDFETGAKVAGSQFYFLYGDGALLEIALISFAMEKLLQAGFTPVITPDLAKSRYYLGTGYAPKGNEAQTYTLEGEDLGLIATAEVTLAGKHADEIIPEQSLPLKYIGYSHCYRQEAGAYGKYSKGLYRVHQFTKAEMFIYCTPEESEKMHAYLLEQEEKIYQELGIPYRVSEMCAGDLGAMATRKFDVEAWMPGRGEYGEVTSTSNCTDYQARNINVKFKRKSGKSEFAHMLNGTAIATSRTIIAILENYQKKDGSVTVPEVLRKWMGEEIISPKA